MIGKGVGVNIHSSLTGKKKPFIDIPITQSIEESIIFPYISITVQIEVSFTRFHPTETFSFRIVHRFGRTADSNHLTVRYLSKNELQYRCAFIHLIF